MNEVVHDLGLVSIYFQSLESAIKITMWQLVSKAEILVGALITAELSFQSGIKPTLRACPISMGR